MFFFQSKPDLLGLKSNASFAQNHFQYDFKSFEFPRDNIKSSPRKTLKMSLREMWGNIRVICGNVLVCPRKPMFVLTQA
jgi:hypothetical protein